MGEVHQQMSNSPQHGKRITMQARLVELSEKIAKVMEAYDLKVYDLEFINELIEKTIERDLKECSY